MRALALNCTLKRAPGDSDAMLSETKDDGRLIAYDKVAGVVVTANEDGARHCIAEIAGALNDIGYTIAAQGWTYRNRGPGPGEECLTTDETECSHRHRGHGGPEPARGGAGLKAHPLPAPGGS